MEREEERRGRKDILGDGNGCQQQLNPCKIKKSRKLDKLIRCFTFQFNICPFCCSLDNFCYLLKSGLVYKTTEDTQKAKIMVG